MSNSEPLDGQILDAVVKEHPVRITKNHLISGFLPALVTVLLLSPIGSTEAQTTRSFQMGLYVDRAPNVNATTLAPLGADIAMLGEGSNPKPNGLFIVNCHSCTGSDPFSSTDQYDWSQVAAVLVDEPYRGVDSSLDVNDCASGNRGAIAIVGAELQAAASKLKTLNPNARFWVNFTEPEGLWMVACNQPGLFNATYINVVSYDYYIAYFGSVGPFYALIAANPAYPGQQLALIPGTFYESGFDNSLYLPSFFEYANEVNQHCNPSLTPPVYSGSYAGCLVWIVLGFPAFSFPCGSNTCNGVLNQSGAVTTAWDKELALPILNTPARLAPALQQLLLSN